MAAFVLAVELVWLAVAIPLRGAVQWRRTGSIGFRLGRGGIVELLGGILSGAAIVTALAAPILDLAGVVGSIPALLRPLWQVIGVALLLAGAVASSAAQFAMGDSWRIGVDPNERTALVTAGPYRWVRNPIYTAFTAVFTGAALALATSVALVSAALAILAVQVQARLIEEPYLRAAHGPAYAAYAAATGRFLPGLGRLRHPTGAWA
ncbi:MAG: methyltransferase family protein [Egibacteraceae bacterium]